MPRPHREEWGLTPEPRLATTLAVPRVFTLEDRQERDSGPGPQHTPPGAPFTRIQSELIRPPEMTLMAHGSQRGLS